MTKKTTHCPLLYAEMTEAESLDRDALTHEWPDLLLYAFPPIPLIWGVLNRVWEKRPKGALGSAQMAEHDMVSLTADPNHGASQAVVNTEGLSVPNGGITLAPLSRQAETLGLATGGTQSVIDCSEGVRHTVLNACAQSSRTMYANRWRLFTTWCTTHSLKHFECPVTAILDFLQHLLDDGRSPATLRVYVAALAAYRAPTEGAFPWVLIS